MGLCSSNVKPAIFLEVLIPHQVQKRAHPVDPEGGGEGSLLTTSWGYWCLQNKSHWHRAHQGEIGSPISPQPGNPSETLFWRVWREIISPNASCVEYNAFWSSGRRVPELLETSPRPSQEPALGSWVQFGIWGPTCGPRDQTHKRCAPKTCAELRLQNSEWSHRVQVMAPNHLGPLGQ